MFSYKPIYFVIFALIFVKTNADISDKRLCVDENCSKLISIGKTLLKYTSTDKDILSFAPNEDVKVFSYGAGSKPELFGVEINGKRGYINKMYFREIELIKKPTLLVDIKKPQSKPDVPSETVNSEISADHTKQPFEIVDGTVIPLEPEFTTTVPLPTFENENEVQKVTTPLETVPDIQNINVSQDQEKIENSAAADKIEEHVKVPDTKSINVSDNQKLVENNTAEISEDPEVSKLQDTKSINESDAQIKVENSAADISKEPEVKLPDTQSINVNDGKVENNSADVDEELEDDDSGIEEIADEEDDDDDEENDEAEKDSESVQNINDTVAVDNVLPNDQSINITDTNNEDKSESVENIMNILIPSDNVLPNDQSTNTDSNSDFSFNNSEDSLNNSTSEDLAKVSEIAQNLTESSLNKSDAVDNLRTETVNNVPVDDLKKDDEIIDKKVENTVEELNVDNVEALDVSEKSINTDKKDIYKFTEVYQTVEEKVGLPITTEVPLDVETPSSIEIENTSTVSVEYVTDQSLNLDDFTPEFKDIQDSIDINTNQMFTGDSIDDDLEIDEVPNHILHQETFDINAEQKISDPDASLNSDSPNENISEGFWSSLTSFFNFGSQENYPADQSEDLPLTAGPQQEQIFAEPLNDEFCTSKDNRCPKVDVKECPICQDSVIPSSSSDISLILTDILSSNMFLYLVTTALSVIILVFVSVIFDKCRREAPLIARINKLEKDLLTTIKENEMLQERVIESDDHRTQLVVDSVPNEVVEELHQKLAQMANIKQALEEQIQALEKELDNSTEVGIELNKIISEMLNSTDGSEILKENIEQMQKKLLEQQDTINTVNGVLNVKETENHELHLELDISNKKVADLQGEVDKMVEKILKLEEEKDRQNSTLEKEVTVVQLKYKEAVDKEQILNREVQSLKQQLNDSQRMAEIKVKEYDTLKNSIGEIKSVKNNKDVLKSLLEVTEVKAQLEQSKSENLRYLEQLSQEREVNISCSSKMQALLQEITELRGKYEKADKEKVEIHTKLDVLNNYFKEKEEQMQKDISKYESLWAAKEGEATSTTERIKYMQEELQNYKAQNESLKREIVNQEVDLKSQISMLEKKAHENWVANRQTERKLEEARQEAAQLRHRLTIRERGLTEGNNQLRMQSPLHQNGELPLSPPPLDPTQSPPPIFNPRDHLTTSPPLPGMPHFLPPPLGAAPFMPPPPLEGMMPPFMPPLPHGLFPGDHRPPPLGRMSSPPPVGGRYTPESTVYSEYDRYDQRSPSPIYDSEYGASPPSMRTYSPYDEHRDYNRSQARSNGRNPKGLHSSGSENDSLGKSSKKPHRKV